MLQRALVAVIVARLVLAPWAVAQEPGPSPGPIAAAAAREAARARPAEPTQRGPMPKGLKWTGIGLSLAGAMTVFNTAIGNCESNCDDRAIGYVVGGAEFAVGAFLIGLADGRRAPASPATAPHDETEPTEAPIHAAAGREAARLASAATRAPMSNALKWTGIGLVAGSALPIAVARFSDCIPDGPACRHQRRQSNVAAGMLAGTGALLLVIGEAKRGPALPSVSIEDGRATIVLRVTF